MNTKVLLLTTVSSLGLVGAVQAADMPVKVPSVATWTGCYIGGSVGGVHFRTSGSYDDFSVNEGDPIASGKTGFIGGGNLGCNWQKRSFVYGIEGDFSALAGLNSYQAGSHDTDYHFNSNARWLATVRGRAGIATDDTLLYITGGGAFANVRNTLTDFTTIGNTRSETMTGWTVGAGIDYRLTNNWFVRGEFLYVDLGTFHKNFTGAGSLYVSHLSHELMIGRVGLNYKF